MNHQLRRSLSTILQDLPRRRSWRCTGTVWLAVALLCTLACPARATSADALPSVALTLTPSSDQPVGTTIAWTASATGMANPVFQFSVGPAGGPFDMLRDYSPITTFAWTPLQEGVYDILVSAKDGISTTATTQLTVPFTVTSRVSGASATITSTSNPLVALYSAPPCSDGQMAVMFRPITSTSWIYTAAQPCEPGQSRNFLVAGMRPQTAYILQHVIVSFSGTTTSAPQSFTTGVPPATLVFPTITVPQPPASRADSQEPAIFHALVFTPPGSANPLATDLSGGFVWYYDTSNAGLTAILPSQMTPGGTALLIGRDSTASAGDNVVREIDLAGHTLHETNVAAVNVQLVARGQEIIYGFHHDALRLPNGYTAVLGHTLRYINGNPIMGDMLIVLDTNFQVSWTWDAFNYLDPNRQAIQPAGTCGPPPGCELPDPNAADWLHSNGLGWSPSDGDLTISMRSQDWVIKVDYENGAGDGHVVWHLGQDGDFSVVSSDPSPWFSHQHNAHYVDPTTLVVFDNGNTRCETAPQPCDSRGQVYSLDEQNHVATQLLNVDTGVFAGALGSAERLANGDYAFGTGTHGQSIEVAPDGTLLYEQDANTAEFRSYRMASLYDGTNPPLEPCTDPVACTTPTSTATAIPPTATPTSTATAVPPTTTPTSTATAIPPTATPTSTATPVPPTATLAPSSATPAPSTATPTATPTGGFGSSASTPTREPTDTPIVPPSSTLIAPASSTPVVPPSSTPVVPPSSTPAVPPSSTPAVLPSSTPSAVVSRTATVPSPGLHATPAAGAHAPNRRYRPRIQVHLPRGLLRSGTTITVTLETRPHARITVLMQLQAHRVGETGGRSTALVLYHRSLHVTAGARGRAIAHLRVTYRSSRSTPATLVVTVRTADGQSSKTLRTAVMKPSERSKPRAA